ncbi:hypothetical protein DMUE_6385 [Dictyocoela muelleri]|nr:hypothetical protein DMUE_6385 [Dictyocoela muelleri]
MVQESFDLSIIDSTSAKNIRKNTYQVSKKLLWTILSILVAIFIVLLVLTIFFGIKQKRSDVNPTSVTPDASKISTTIPATTTATTTTLAPPVERIPTNLKQENYRLSISPNLSSETFAGNRNIFRLFVEFLFFC